VTLVNHATLLVQQDGLNILTDPVWSDRVSPVGWAGPRRYRSAGLRFEDLPPIDAVVVSHNHYDHLDLPTLKRLHAEHRPRFFVGLGNKALLEGEGIDRVEELDWWGDRELAPGVAVTSAPAQHFSARGLCDRDATLWTSWLVRGPSGMTYFAGDTGFGPHFQQVRERYGSPRAALLPIGAYLPRWFMRFVHISPDEAVEAHRVLGAGTSIAMHYGTFALADDGQFEAPRALRAALENSNVQEDRFWLLEFGHGREVPEQGRDSRR
jgi:L-ascorbate metabolism protein UlaG (beta-lactamase superfamily)